MVDGFEVEGQGSKIVTLNSISELFNSEPAAFNLQLHDHDRSPAN